MNPTYSAEPPRGLLIPETAQILRHYIHLFKGILRLTSGWFLVVGDYRDKYRLAYLGYDAVQAVDALRNRLKEMRGGKPDASIRPELANWINDWVHAPEEESFWDALDGVILPRLNEVLKADLVRLDPSANANERRLLRTIVAGIDSGPDAPCRSRSGRQSAWSQYLDHHLVAIGGIHGREVRNASPSPPKVVRFQRPGTILFNEDIRVGPLVAYEEREKLDPREATIEQFKVFFNEFYAAALLASILFDASSGDFPWEFHSDCGRHFWDEARHSEFGAVRLAEFGVTPSQVNPVLFKETENLPILHRLAYLTRGLEAYFMPRKPKRVRDYLDQGDARSQLFSDHDWSDEINHVRYGSKWTDFLLENDSREVDDVIEEVKAHLSQLRNAPVTTINAPF